MRLGPYELGPGGEHEGIYTGDARILAPAIPDGSVDLIFCDPIYQNIEDYRWLAETAARVLKNDSHLLVWQGQPWLPQTYQALKLLRYRWTFARYRTGGRDPRYAFGWCKWTPLLWYSKGGGLPHPIPDLLIEADKRQAKIHDYQKPLGFTLRMIEAFTDQGAIVVDFFTGGGTTPAVCKLLGHPWLAFEVDPATAELARQRLHNTQPPLFTVAPAQLELELT